MDPKFDTLLRKHNLSVTAARKAVLIAVMKFPHSDADTLYKHARKISGTLSKQAVYDNLRTLTEKGVLRTIQPMGHSALFEMEHLDNHHHIVCRSCGMMTDVHCKHGSAPCLTPAQSMGFVLDEAEVVFWGICPDCQTKTPRKKRK